MGAGQPADKWESGHCRAWKREITYQCCNSIWVVGFAALEPESFLFNLASQGGNYNFLFLDNGPFRLDIRDGADTGNNICTLLLI